MNLSHLITFCFFGLNIQVTRSFPCRCREPSSIEVTHGSTTRKFVLRSKHHKTILGMDKGNSSSIWAFSPDETLLEEHRGNQANVFFSTCDPSIDFKTANRPFSLCLGGQRWKTLVYNAGLKRFQIHSADHYRHRHLYKAEAVVLERANDKNMFPVIYIQLKTVMMDVPHQVLIVNRKRPGRSKARVSAKDIHSDSVKEAIDDMKKAQLIITDIR